MGSFGIYALIVTFIFVIYYVIIICLDLFGSKGEKKEGVEVIHMGTPVNTESVPTVPIAKVKEDKNGKYQIDRSDGSATETYGDESANVSFGDKAEATSATPSSQAPLTAEDIEKADAEVLAMESKAKAAAITQNFNSITPEIQGAVYVDEYTEMMAELALQKARSEEEQVENF